MALVLVPFIVAHVEDDTFFILLKGGYIMTQLVPLSQTQLQSMIDNWIGLDRFFSAPIRQQPTFPPYDTIKCGDDYKIIMALAGYKQSDITITQIEDQLIVSSSGDAPERDAGIEYIHRGIAKRSFKHTFNLGPDIKVDGAELIDGMLTIELHREIPESKQPKLIQIK